MLKMEAIQKEFVVAGHFFRQRRFGGDGGRRHRHNLVRRVAEQEPLTVSERDFEWARSHSGRELQMERFCGSDISRPAPNFRFTDADSNTRFRKLFGDLKVQGDESI